MIKIDLQQIAKKLDMSTDTAREWLLKFADYSPAYLIPLNQYAEKSDFPGIAQIAYKIKSASALLGIFDLMELADTIFINARLKIDIDYRELIAEIEQAFNLIAKI